MPILRNLELSVQDFENTDWRTVPATCPQRECTAYSYVFFEQAALAEKAGSERDQEVFTLLGAICSMLLRTDLDTVFKPAFELPPMRSFVLDDFQDAHLEALASVVETIEDAELRARVADVLWEKRRSKYHSLLPLAIEAYLASAEHLLQDNQSWTLATERLERAVRLTSYANRRDEVLVHLRVLLQKALEQEPSFLQARLIEMVLQFDQDDHAELAESAKAAAHKAQVGGSFHVEGALWGLVADCYRRVGDQQRERDARILQAESLVKIAQGYAGSPSPNYAAAAFHLGRAIESYRRIGGLQTRTRELHRQLLEWQKLYESQMQEAKYTVDITKFVMHYTESVKGQELGTALSILAFTPRSPQVQQLRKLVESYIEKFPLSQMMSTVIVDEQGKYIASNTGLFSDNSKEREKAIQDKMFHEAILHQTLMAQAVILPMIHQVQREHRVRLDDLRFLVSHNSFIPEGHELIFAKGFLAGLNGDFLTAAHLLIPQIENSLRYILSQRGVITSSLDTKTGRQEEQGLDALLSKPELVEILGEDTVFDLRGLLIERFGSNLRIWLCHGLLREEHFFSLQIVYCWWLVFHLTFHGASLPVDNEDSAGS